MGDYSVYSVVLLELSAGTSDNDHTYLTNSMESISYEGKDYLPMDGIEFDIPKITGSVENEDCKINNIRIFDTFLSLLSNNAPFSRIRVSIKEVEIDFDTGAVMQVLDLFSGLVYRVTSDPLIGIMNITCKDWKYYLDITAGVPCCEQCTWQYLGDKGCRASVHSENQTITDVDGLFITIDGPLVDGTPLLFNKGYAEIGGIRIKIKYHSTGNAFQLSKPAPSSWLGQVVTLYAGCDRTLNTCRTIHNNEINFLGLGYSMVDYNALSESP